MYNTFVKETKLGGSMNKKIEFEDALEVIVDMNIAAHKVRSRIGAEKMGIISPQDLRFLFLISRKGLTCVSELKEEMIGKHQLKDKKKVEVRIAKILTSLEQSGFIKRTSSKEDKRQKDLEITPKGHMTLEKVLKEMKISWEEVQNEKN